MLSFFYKFGKFLLITSSWWITSYPWLVGWYIISWKSPPYEEAAPRLCSLYTRLRVARQSRSSKRRRIIYLKNLYTFSTIKLCPREIESFTISSIDEASVISVWFEVLAYNSDGFHINRIRRLRIMVGTLILTLTNLLLPKPKILPVISC